MRNSFYACILVVLVGAEGGGGEARTETSLEPQATAQQTGGPPVDREITITVRVGTLRVDPPVYEDIGKNDRVVWKVLNYTPLEVTIGISDFRLIRPPNEPGGDLPQKPYRDPLDDETEDKEVTVPSGSATTPTTGSIYARVRLKKSKYYGYYKYSVYRNGMLDRDPELEIDN